MGRIRCETPRALLFFAAFSKDPALIERAKVELANRFGSVAVAGPRFPFDDTRYYERTMGVGLLKELFSTGTLIDQSELAGIKHFTNELEVRIGREAGVGVERPLNIDPGMVDLGKVMLASTKNHAHRVYQGDGIFVEVTLYLREGAWEAWPWTYPDYRRPEVHAFFHAVRESFRARPETS